MNALSLNRKMGATLLLLMCLLLAACGSSTANKGADHSAVPSANTVEKETGSSAATGGKEIKHLMGVTQVPAKPQRVFVMQNEYADHMLTIGEKPYAILVTPQYNDKLLPYIAGKLGEVELVKGGSEVLNLEEILELKPDLILSGKGVGEQAYNELSKIAPTVVLGVPDRSETASKDPNAGLVADDWQIDLMKIAEIFGKEDTAKQEIAKLDEKMQAASAEIAALPSKRIAYIRVRDNELQLYGTEGHPLNYLLFDKLGFQPSALAQVERMDLSQEKIPELGADYIFMQADGADGEKLMGEITQSSLWQNVEAVKKNQVFIPEYWLYLSWGKLGREAIIDQIVEFIK
ncbi:iron complex transport system substrate-binding protein [Paenibacillus algorifonticola]|uniref:Iron complex transport system substrate-binding protein n=1 Tax=Paenibacillus algorifonticola TaxID=684063 RepID=A0A1I2HGP4_9BACL|nr:ABC transporter substrate-binding protein [Paenibacillus algorifonticola]SFF28872.1 iron complex transport system substrate-binding protein [Paenibacillus algorifonticola]